MATATPFLLRDPGELYWAPLGSAVPTNTVAGSVFTDAITTPYVPIGATAEGTTWATQTNVEGIFVAELLTAIAYATTERSTSLAFAAADFTLANFKRLNNGGTIALVSGTGATALNTYEEPALGAEVRSMLLWQSTDKTFRLLARQTINGGEISSTMQKAPAYGTIPVQFNFEQPVGAAPYTIYSAGAARLGT